ncbi:hypothetical protein T11_14663 [Trichinella zimbabwensis]|uniref:Uncharacterized protein n=1 Tax=Trichinella zimbabwensis TaxID=268475 RepID=A0A0V1GLP6_9BILA|nr:hypothetical protein T11_14663 [Trichinella zimbabwensis]
MATAFSLNSLYDDEWPLLTVVHYETTGLHYAIRFSYYMWRHLLLLAVDEERKVYVLFLVYYCFNPADWRRMKEQQL